MLMLQLPIAKQQDQLRPDLVYYGFANSFVVAMQDKRGGEDSPLEKYTGGWGWE